MVLTKRGRYKRLIGLSLIGVATAALAFSVSAGPRSSCWMTGGGSIFDGLGQSAEYTGRTTHGFVVHCDPRNSDNLQINWEGNRFHLTDLITAMCPDDPDIQPEPPVADFDTFIGMGVGKLNNRPGATVNFTFTDAGEPGVPDTASILIMDADGNVVLNISGPLTFGNHQAHTN